MFIPSVNNPVTHDAAGNFENPSSASKSHAGERNLLSAILGHAFLDLQSNRPQRLRQEALQYLIHQGLFSASHYQEYPFMAKNICFALGLDHSAIKSLALQMFHNPDSVKFEW